MGQRMGIYFFNLAEHPRKSTYQKKVRNALHFLNYRRDIIVKRRKTKAVVSLCYWQTSDK